jgi:hypothetical protein
MRNEGLAKTLIAGAAVAARRIVKFSGAANTVTQAAAATDKLIGVSDLGADVAGETMDVILTDIALVEYGGTVAAGDLLTADASGRAVVAAPASGANNRIVGVAMLSGVSGDIGSVRLSPTSIQG